MLKKAHNSLIHERPRGIYCEILETIELALLNDDDELRHPELWHSDILDVQCEAIKSEQFENRHFS